MALDMTSALTIKANVKGEQELRGLQKGLNNLSGQSKKTAGAMDRLKTASAGALGALKSLLPILGVAAFAKMGNDVLQLGDKLQKMSEKTGASVPVLDKLRQASNLAGTDFNALTRLFPMLAKNIVQTTEKGTGPAAEAFKKLGIATANSAGQVRKSEEVLLDIADAFSKMENGTEKADLAYKLFGARVGADLIPMLNQGRDAIEGLNSGFTQISAERMAAFNDQMAQLGEQFRVVAIQVMEALLPALKTLVTIIDGAVKTFNSIPGPIKTLVVSFGALALATTTLGIALPIVVGSFKALAALKIGALISGWVGSMGPLVAGIQGIGAVVTAVFTAPAAPFVLAGLAVAGIIAVVIKYRKQIVNIFEDIGDFFKDFGDNVNEVWSTISDAFKDVFIDPAINLVQGLIDRMVNAFKGLWGLIKSPFIAVFNGIKGIMNKILASIAGSINNVVGVINNIISAANNISAKVNLPAFPLMPTVQVPQFAEGGVVGRRGGQLAVVGEAGREYIIPERKMNQAMMNWLSGKKGEAVIPRFAEGGVVGSSVGGSSVGSANINLKTGPVMQMNGQQYVTMGDLEGALQDFAGVVFGNASTTGGRRFQGVR